MPRAVAVMIVIYSYAMLREPYYTSHYVISRIYVLQDPYGMENPQRVSAAKLEERSQGAEINARVIFYTGKKMFG